jgi:hypothetical protein
VNLDRPQVKENSFRRYRLVATELDAARGRIDLPFAKKLMATHAGDLASICRHPRKGNESATISASIFMPVKRAMFFCHGLPCQGSYLEQSDYFALD